MAFQSGQQHARKLDFDTLIIWADILGVEVDYPPIDDMYPDWENELRVEVGEAMAKAGKN
jgi:hypothetical protein